LDLYARESTQKVAYSSDGDEEFLDMQYVSIKKEDCQD
jgi:hypothetical protein